jgi:hypothetical protein
MSLMVEGVVDGGMDVEKTLRGSKRLEPLHLVLSSPHDLMGVFSALFFLTLRSLVAMPKFLARPCGRSRHRNGGMDMGYRNSLVPTHEPSIPPDKSALHRDQSSNFGCGRAWPRSKQ